jgi:hypothetical protein
MNARSVVYFYNIKLTETWKEMIELNFKLLKRQVHIELATKEKFLHNIQQ